MAERKRDILLDDDTYERMLGETQVGTGSPQPVPTAQETPSAPTAPVYDDSLRRQQSELYGQITNRGPFAYDPKNDPLYGIYKDRYVQNGRMAMKDTMGQAAALTGGYGSSYGQAVGQQQYDASLQGLADVIPELYGQAYEMYQDEGDRLMQQYQMLGAQADKAYDQYRDQLGDWQYERAWQEQQNQTAYSQRQDAYSQLYSLIGSTGYQPSAEELAAAGMTQEAADALRNEYLRQTGQLPAAGGSGSGGSGGAYYGGSGSGSGSGSGGGGDGNGNGSSGEREANPQWDRDIAYITSQIGRAPNQQSAYTAMQSFLNSPYYSYASDAQKEAIRRAYERAVGGSGSYWNGLDAVATGVKGKLP